MEQLLSIGIDIGTATTQIVFSRLQVENTASSFAPPKAEIIEKQVVYRSNIHLTPLSSPTLIDANAVRAIVSDEFRLAGFSPGDVQTGAVIVTGETACKENAQTVLRELSGFAGQFVVYTAGPDLEALIAGQGSGAQSYSKRNHCTVANLDIGGGTTNIAVFDCGEAVACGSLDIGGKLVRIDKTGGISYISPRARIVADDLGERLAVGDMASVSVLSRITDHMNDVLEQVLGFRDPKELATALVTEKSAPLQIGIPIDALCFSGGVADCIQKAQPPLSYGDIGVLLGQSLAHGIVQKASCITPAETIRATVIGAGIHTLRVSGGTINYDANVLPVRNVPVLYLKSRELEAALNGAFDLAGKMRWMLEQSSAENILLGFDGPHSPSYGWLQNAAKCIGNAAREALHDNAPILVAVGADIAKALGQQIDGYLKGTRPVVCVDGVTLHAGDYVDIGTPLLDGVTLPVVVKTLLFGGKGAGV